MHGAFEIIRIKVYANVTTIQYNVFFLSTLTILVNLYKLDYAITNVIEAYSN